MTVGLRSSRFIEEKYLVLMVDIAKMCGAGSFLEEEMHEKKLR